MTNKHVGLGGVKSALLDGDLRFNAAIYRCGYEDLQNQQFDSSTFVFTTFNAGEVENLGVEIDVNYRVNESLSVRSLFAYTDTEYVSEFINIAGVDLDGQARQNSPEFAFTTGVDYVKPLNNGLRIDLGATLHYSDDYTTSTSQQGSPNEYVQDSFWRADLVASLSAMDNRWSVVGGRWSVSLVGRNFSDEVYIVDKVGRPGAIPNALGQRDQAHLINRGRQIFIEVSYEF